MPFLQTSYNRYPDLGLEGGIVDAFPHQMYTYANKSGAIAQSYTVAVGTAAVSTVYSLSISAERRGIAEAISITSAAGATAATILAQLEAAFNASAVLKSQYSATIVGATLVVTARAPGLDSTFILFTSGGGVGYTATTTAVGTNPIILPFGRFATYDATALSGFNRNSGATSGAYDLPIKLPSSSAEVNDLAGMIIRTSAYQPSNEFGYYTTEGVLPFAAANVMNQGRFYFRPVTDIKLGDPLHIYISGVNQGKARASADGALTAQYLAGRIRVIGKYNAGQIAIGEIN